MSTLRTASLSNLSNAELILACDNEWNLGGLPNELAYELHERFRRLAPLNEHPVQDPQQLDLFM